MIMKKYDDGKILVLTVYFFWIFEFCRVFFEVE